MPRAAQGMHGSTATRVPTGSGQPGPASITRPAISWPRTKGNDPIETRVGDGPVLWANRWRSLPQIPPVVTATRAHAGPGSSGSGRSTSDAGKAGSAMSNWTARTAGSVRVLRPPAGPRPRDGRERPLAYGAESCGCRTPLSTRSASGGSPSSRGSSPPTSCRRPSRRCGCTSRSPRTTSPIRPATPSTPRSQFAGVEEFPYRSWDLNRLAFHPDLVDAAERYLGTDRAPPLQGRAVGEVRGRRQLRPAPAP